MSTNTNVTAIRVIQPEVSVDRISDLPEDIICHILSSVHTIDAVRMSGLSRRWRRIWRSLRVLDFNENFELKSFCLFVDQCLNLRKNDTKIERFRLAIRPFWVDVINRWLSQVGTWNLVELDLHFYMSEYDLISQTYRLSPYVLPMRSLTKLSLSNVDITGLHSISLPLLKSLGMDSVKLDDQVLHRLLSLCSNLEKVTLARCYGLSDPRFSSLSLKFLQIDRSVARKAHLVTINLESFAYDGFQFGMISLNLSSMVKLRNLSIANAKVLRNALKFLISKLPCLESLTLCCCQMNSIEIHSHCLKRFIFSDRVIPVFKLQIDAPNLSHFSFKGSVVDLELKAQNILEADAEFSNVKYDEDFYTGLLSFLAQLDSSKNLKLRVHSQEALTFSAEIRSSFTAPLCNVKEISLELKEPPTAISEMEDSLRWMTNTNSSASLWAKD